MKLLYNAYIRTQDPTNPIGSAIVIDRERIVAVGETNTLLPQYPNAEKQNMEGRVILPGLTDAHLHLKNYALSLQRIDCETDTKEECLRRVEERAKKAKPDEWILGHGWNQNIWGNWPTASELDAIAPNNPVYLTQTTGHYGVANTYALKIAEINRNSKDPPAGTIDRDASGRPTGVLMSYEEFEGWQSTLELLEDPDWLVWLSAGRKNALPGVVAAETLLVSKERR